MPFQMRSIETYFHAALRPHASKLPIRFTFPIFPPLHRAYFLSELYAGESDDAFPFAYFAIDSRFTLTFPSSLSVYYRCCCRRRHFIIELLIYISEIYMIQ